MVSGEPCEFETHIKIMDYSTAIAQMQANQEKKEALASILADCIVDEKGEPEFTEAEIRQHFSKPLIDAVWAEILKKNFLGKVTAKQNLKEKNSGQSLSSTALEVEPLPKPSETLVTENISTGGSTESAEEA